MQRTDIEVRAADGRRLFVDVHGPEGGDVVLFHAGTPGARLLYESELDEASRRGMRHVLYSRPGYEGSDRQAGRSVADCAADAAAVADALGIDAFYSVGASGGGPHALACAALLPERVRAVAVVASLAPPEAEGLDWSAGMGQENVEECAAAGAGEVELQRFIEREAAALRAIDNGAQLLEALGDRICDADRSTLEAGRAAYEVACFKRLLAGGIWGWFDDDLAYRADWGFALGQIAAPTTVWQGEKDRMVPAAHAEWLAARLPASDLRLFPDEGHLLLTRHYGSVLDELTAAPA